MNYEKIYKKLYEKAKNRTLDRKGTDLHHFVPKCFFKKKHHKFIDKLSNILCIEHKSINDNSYLLTQKEHFISHMLIYKILGNHPLVLLSSQLLFYKNVKQTSKKYCLYRKEVQKIASKNTKGFGTYLDEKGDTIYLPVQEAKDRKLKGANYKKVVVIKNGVSKQVSVKEFCKNKYLYQTHSDNFSVYKDKKGNHFRLHKNDTKIKDLNLVGVLKGRILSEEHKKALTTSRLGKHNTKEHNQKISIAQSGKKVSKETRKKMSENAKGKTVVFDKELSKNVKITIDEYNKHKNTRYLNCASHEYINNYKGRGLK